MNTQLSEKLGKLQYDANALLQKENRSAEDVAKASKLMDDMQSLIEADKAEERLASFRVSSNPVPRGEVSTGEVRTAEQIRVNTNNELRKHMLSTRDGMSVNRTEFRDLTLAADGSFLVPTGVADPTIAKKSAGYILSVLKKLDTTTGNPMVLPLLNDTQNGWVLNSSNVATTDPAISSVTCAVEDFRLDPILLDFSLIEDSSVDLVQYIYSSAQNRWLWSMSNLVTNGDSVVDGLINITASVTSSANAALKYSDLTALRGALDPAYQADAVLTMNNETLSNQVLSMTTSTGLPLFKFQTGVTSGGVDFIGIIDGSLPVKLNQYLPNWGAGNVAIQYGSFADAYTFRSVVPSAFASMANGTVDPTFKFALAGTGQRYIDQGKYGILGYGRVGGKITISSNAPSPVYSLTVHS